MGRRGNCEIARAWSDRFLTAFTIFDIPERSENNVSDIVKHLCDTSGALIGVDGAAQEKWQQKTDTIVCSCYVLFGFLSAHVCLVLQRQMLFTTKLALLYQSYIKAKLPD